MTSKCLQRKTNPALYCQTLLMSVCINYITHHLPAPGPAAVDRGSLQVRDPGPDGPAGGDPAQVQGDGRRASARDCQSQGHYKGS